MSSQLTELTALELSVFSALKSRGHATAGQIRRELPWPSEAKGIRVALLRLEEEGLIRHSIASGQIFYHSVAPLEYLASGADQPLDRIPTEPNLI